LAVDGVQEQALGRAFLDVDVRGPLECIEQPALGLPAAVPRAERFSGDIRDGEPRAGVCADDLESPLKDVKRLPDRCDEWNTRVGFVTFDLARIEDGEGVALDVELGVGRVEFVDAVCSGAAPCCGCRVAAVRARLPSEGCARRDPQRRTRRLQSEPPRAAEGPTAWLATLRLARASASTARACCRFESCREGARAAPAPSGPSRCGG